MNFHEFMNFHCLTGNPYEPKWYQQWSDISGFEHCSIDPAPDKMVKARICWGENYKPDDWLVVSCGIALMVLSVVDECRNWESLSTNHRRF